MITIDETPREKQGGKYEFQFKGLSSDTKPMPAYDAREIANGSTFLEMDTMSVYFYDEASRSWLG